MAQTGSWEATHGRDVLSFTTLGDKPFTLNANHPGELTIEFDYLGDHAEVWIVGRKDDVEIGRWNIKDVARISWPHDASVHAA